MDKMKIFALILIALEYVLTAAKLLSSYETVLSKHPLFIYSVIFLAFLVLAFRLEGKAKTIMLWFVAFFLGLYYTSLMIGG